MNKPADLNRERRIREHTRAIAERIRDNPNMAARTFDYLEQQSMTETSVISIRLPVEMVERIDRLLDEHPALVTAPAGTGRATRNAAIRVILERGIEATERKAREAQP